MSAYTDARDAKRQALAERIAYREIAAILARVASPAAVRTATTDRDGHCWTPTEILDAMDALVPA